MVARLEARGVVAAADRPDSCIVNVYERGDCIPPHIDHRDFARPFVTLSLLSEQARAARAAHGSTGDARALHRQPTRSPHAAHTRRPRGVPWPHALPLPCEQRILFGREIEVLGEGEFSAPVELPLPVGSALVFDGNGADLTKHCVPAVTAQRVSLTFRRMGEAKMLAIALGAALSTAPPELPEWRDRERQYGLPTIGFREPWLAKVKQ